MAMLLKGEDGKEFELAMISDRIPEAQDGFGDDKSFTISIRVATEDVQFEETSPNLSAHELHALAEWLESAAGEGEPASAEIDLLEPTLNFQVVKAAQDHLLLRIRFHLEDVPDELTVGADTELRHIDLKLPREAIRTAAAELRDEIEEFLNDPKDDTLGEASLGELTEPDEDLSLIHRITRDPPGAGRGEDNAGNR